MILLLNMLWVKAICATMLMKRMMWWALIETARGGSDESSQAQPMFSQGSQVKRIDDGVDQCGDGYNDYNDEEDMMMALEAH